MTAAAAAWHVSPTHRGVVSQGLRHGPNAVVDVIRQILAPAPPVARGGRSGCGGVARSRAFRRCRCKSRHVVGCRLQLGALQVELYSLLRLL